jgi:hypothetical protein
MSGAPHLTWLKGGTADVIELRDDAIVLRSTTSAPPGARLEAKFGELTVKVKSHGSHKEDDGTFTLKGRLIDANRALRDALAALLPSSD